jgi:hypothetical protein
MPYLPLHTKDSRCKIVVLFSKNQRKEGSCSDCFRNRPVRQTPRTARQAQYFAMRASRFVR